MRKFWFLLLAAVAMSTALQSCDDGPKVPLQDEDGRIFLDKDNYIEATTSFTEEELLNLLLSKKWVLDGYPYIYDTYKCQRLYVNKGILSFCPPQVYHFKDNYHFDEYNSMTEKLMYNGDSQFYNFTYSLSGKVLTMINEYKNIDSTTRYITTNIYSVVGINDECIVLDSDYNPELMALPDGFMEFDESNAKNRFVWRAVYY